MSTSKQEEVVDLQAAMAKIAELTAKLDEKDKTIQVVQAEVKELTANQEGWLITTKNPLYDGSTMGIKFNSGLAFIPSTSTFPGLGGKVKDTVFTPDAKAVAKMLADDFGYEIQFYSYEDLKALKGRMEERKAERQTAEAAVQAEQERVMQQTMRPRRMGV